MPCDEYVEPQTPSTHRDDPVSHFEDVVSGRRSTLSNARNEDTLREEQRGERPAEKLTKLQVRYR